MWVTAETQIAYEPRKRRTVGRISYYLFFLPGSDEEGRMSFLKTGITYIISSIIKVEWSFQ